MFSKLYYIIGFILLTSSCQKSDNCYQNISDDYLKSLSTRNGYYVDVIVPLENGQMCILNSTILLYTYDQYYKEEYISEFHFLRDLYAGKITDIDQYFEGDEKMEIDQNIMSEYKKYGIKYIIDKYLKETATEEYTFKNYINYTIVQIMFINNFYLYFSDYAPTYNFTKELKDLAIPEDW